MTSSPTNTHRPHEQRRARRHWPGRHAAWRPGSTLPNTTRRASRGAVALAAISVDGTVGSDIRRKLLELPDVITATVVRFEGLGA